jgi:serine/threonine protein kinase
MVASERSLRRFEIEPGHVLAGKYVVEKRIGAGWEGEVFQVRERRTRIRRAAKLFYPIRNPQNRTAARYARKLERLRGCRIITQYHHSEVIDLQGLAVTCLVSELVTGERLSDLVRRQRGRRLEVFEGFHLLHSLAVGLECIHQAGEYHGDLHAGNVLVRRVGLHFELKVYDFFYWGRANRDAMQTDIIDSVRLFYDALGGQARYGSQPAEVKAICCGLKRSLIRKKFPSANKLRRHLETFVWQGS